jgi:nucleoside-diphosphate-sugar epimerase
VGWWYQITFPALPSGRGSEALTFPINTIHGDGDQTLTYIDKRDIGKFVARILDDERTVNQYVYAYSETHTEREIIAIAERISGEKVATNQVRVVPVPLF